MKPVISVLGAGLMGSALVRTFVKQGYETFVWNRTRSRADLLSKDGARVASSVSDAVSAAGIIVLNVSDYPTGQRLLKTAEIERLLRGKLLVQLTTGTPKQSREMAAWAQANGILYLDGAIMVTPDVIGTSDNTIFYSGPAPLFEEWKPVFAALGGNSVYLGADYAFASTLDSAMLSFYWAVMFGVQQAIALSKAEGFPADVLSTSLTSMTPFFQKLAADGVQRVETQEFTATLATLAICHQSVRLLIEQSKDSGVDHSMLDVFDRIFQKAVDAGYSDQDMAVVSKFMRQSSGAAASGSKGAA